MVHIPEFPAGERGIGYSQRFSSAVQPCRSKCINDFEFNALFKFSDCSSAR
ncbi:omptin family outer membrane protease [Klebsiella pneumoniae]|uniref:omptin family outer membrane protease n=1 Tax=Klebsiella pneumoniae TaxID=573 RepID=UPI003A598872